MFLIPDSFWKIKKAKQKGLGVFAKKEIKAGTIIGDYLGRVTKTAEYDLETDEKGLFLMYLTDEASIYPDLSRPGIHLLNHSCEPNCWIYIYKGHTLFFTLRKIEAGEELTIAYLLAPEDKTKSTKHVCKCGSRSCTGTMHLSEEKYERWQEFQSKKPKTKTAKYVFGRNLPKLNSHPKIDPRDPIYDRMVL